MHPVHFDPCILHLTLPKLALKFQVSQHLKLICNLHLSAGTKKGGDTPSVIAPGIPNITGRLGGSHGGDYSSSISAGLPDIEGETPPFPMLNSNTSGAFSYIAVSTSTGAGDGSAWTTRGKMRFKASKSNKIYGRFQTVQQSAISAIVQFKI